MAEYLEKIEGGAVSASDPLASRRQTVFGHLAREIASIHSLVSRTPLHERASIIEEADQVFNAVSALTTAIAGSARSDEQVESMVIALIQEETLPAHEQPTGDCYHLMYDGAKEWASVIGKPFDTEHAPSREYYENYTPESESKTRAEG